jgi:hypothetical protein
MSEFQKLHSASRWLGRTEAAQPQNWDDSSGVLANDPLCVVSAEPPADLTHEPAFYFDKP